MIKQLIHPRFLVFLCAAFLIVATLISLGFWQLQRQEWKIAQIEKRAIAFAAPPLVLDYQSVGTLDDDAIKDFQRVRIDGNYRHDAGIELAFRPRHGIQGKQILTPIVTDSGHYVLIDRGWLADHDRAAFTNRPHQEASPVTIKGILRPVPAKDRWFRHGDRQRQTLDAEIIHRHIGLVSLFQKEPPTHYIEALCEDPCPAFLVQRSRPEPLANNHLSYALTWFSLALVAAVVAVLRAISYYRAR